MEKEKRPSLIKRISRKFSGTPKPKLTEEEIEFLVSPGQNLTLGLDLDVLGTNEVIQ